MKKVYVRPVASSVAFAVNENIATSASQILNGVVSYVQAVEDCNKIINSTSIETGLAPGVTSIEIVLENLRNQMSTLTGSALEELAAILAAIEKAYHENGEAANFNCANA